MLMFMGLWCAVGVGEGGASASIVVLNVWSIIGALVDFDDAVLLYLVWFARLFVTYCNFKL